MTTSGKEEQAERILGARDVKQYPLVLFARKNGLQIAIVFVLLAIWGLFVIGAPRTFLSSEIYAAYMSVIPFFAVVALPLTMVIIAGEIDLSFPSIMAIGMVAFLFVLNLTGSALLASIGGLVMGFIAGLINGVIVVRLGVPSIVATIGTQFFWRGVVLVITQGGGESLVGIKHTPVHEIFVGKVFGYVPAQMLWTVAIGVIMWFLLNRHRFGAHVYLIGDNEDSARLMGVNADFTRTMVFALVGVAAAFGGILASMEVSYFWPTLGEGYMLKTLSSVFLGGTSVFGGVGTIFGTFVASFIIGAIEAGTVAIGLTGFWTQLIYGVIITVSVSIQVLLNKRLGRS
jgi:simple sugar transport system permease protein